MENNSFCKDSKYCNLDWIHNNIDSIIVKCSSAWFWTSVMDTCISFYFISILTLFYTCKLLMFVLVFSTWFRMASLLDRAIRCLDSNLLWFSSNTNLFNHSTLNKKTIHLCQCLIRNILNILQECICSLSPQLSIPILFSFPYIRFLVKTNAICLLRKHCINEELVVAQQGGARVNVSRHAWEWILVYSFNHFIQTWNATRYEDLSNNNSSHWMRIGPSRRCPCSHKQCPYSQTFPKQIQQNTPILYIPAIRILALTLEP